MKKYILIILVLVAVRSFVGCKSKDIIGQNDTEPLGLMWTVFLFTNENGEDKFSPGTNNSFDPKKISVYTEINGKEHNIENWMLTQDSSRMLSYYPYTTDKYDSMLSYNGLFVELPIDKTTPNVYIRFPDSSIDTIKYEYIGYNRKTKVWYNGKLVWTDSGMGSVIIIEK